MAPLLLDSHEEDQEELLAALEESLGSQAVNQLNAPLASKIEQAPRVWPTAKSIGYGLVHWPVEVRFCIASFIPWRELVTASLLCLVWRGMELQDAIWQLHFGTVWPRVSRRRLASQGSALPWRALFRVHWVAGSRTEDPSEEDWLDFDAARDLEAGAASPSGSEESEIAAQQELQDALRACREEVLEQKGIHVPSKVDEGHVCGRSCKYHRLSVAKDIFVCESSGALHRCRQREPCLTCVRSDDDCFLVCPASGRCWLKQPNAPEAEEEMAEGCAALDSWDPDFGTTAQCQWFERGYNMSEDQAQASFFGIMRGRTGNCRG